MTTPVLNDNENSINEINETYNAISECVSTESEVLSILWIRGANVPITGGIRADRLPGNHSFIDFLSEG